MKDNYTLAVYSDVILPEHQGNPLLEALPVKMSDQEIVEALSYFPEYSEEISDAEDSIRLEYLTRLERVRQPLAEYLPCFRMIEKGIKRSLSSRNPLLAATNYKNIYSKIDKAKTYAAQYQFNSDGIGMSLIGPSGVGKSKMLEQIYSFYPNVIRHENYNGAKLNLLQVPMLFVECPGNATPKGLCLAIIDSFHKVLMIPKRNIARKTLDELIIEVSGYVDTYFLGVLVIDEVQKLEGSKSGSKAIQDFLLSLINECGVSVLFCGNRELYKLLSTTFRNARRAEAGGLVDMAPLLCIDDYSDESLTSKDKERGYSWDVFTEALWDYQWTRVYTELTHELKRKLYELSHGNIDLAVRTFQKSQEILITSKSSDERITEEVLEFAYSEISGLTSTVLDPNNRGAIDLRRGRKSRRNVAIHSTEGKKQKNIVIAGDLSRPQHPEFADFLDEIQTNGFVFEKVKVMNKIRKALDYEQPIDYFKRSNLWANFN